MKKKIPLKIEENKSFHKKKVCYKCREEFSTDDDNKKYYKVREYCHYIALENIEELLIIFVI